MVERSFVRSIHSITFAQLEYLLAILVDENEHAMDSHWHQRKIIYITEIGKRIMPSSANGQRMGRELIAFYVARNSIAAI